MTSTLVPGDDVVAWRADAVDVGALLSSPVGLTGRQLGERLVELDRLRRALEAATVEVLGEAHRSGAYREDGHVNLASWARGNVTWSRSEALQRAREVDLVGLCPEVSAALAAGRLGVAQAGELAEGAGQPTSW